MELKSKRDNSKNIRLRIVRATTTPKREVTDSEKPSSDGVDEKTEKAAESGSEKKGKAEEEGKEKMSKAPADDADGEALVQKLVRNVTGILICPGFA